MNFGGLRETVKFLAVGLLNTVLGLIIIYVAKWFFRAGDITANVWGYALGILVSFVLNSQWTFAYSGPKQSAFLKFLLVALMAYGANLLVVMLLIHRGGLNSYIAQAFGIPAYTLVSYLASKYFVFRSRASASPRS